MKKLLFTGVIILFLLLMTGAECDNCDDGTNGDLIAENPTPAAGSTGFCVLVDGKWKAGVIVKNIGTDDIGVATTTAFDFGTFGVQTVSTPPLAAGAATTVTVDFPTGCFNPDCNFTITVDSTDAVAETNEGNNEASGICIG